MMGFYLMLGFKASETLLGIETGNFQFIIGAFKGVRFKASETLLGIETGSQTSKVLSAEDSKPLKPF